MRWRKQVDQSLDHLVEMMRFTDRVSAKIRGQLDEAKIYRTVMEEFTRTKRYTASIMLLTDDGGKLRIAQTSPSPAKRKRVENAAGPRLKDYEIDLSESVIYGQVVREGKTIEHCVGDTARELPSQPVASELSKTMGHQKRLSILTPLKRNAKIMGALVVSSPELCEYFIPSVKSLAQHISCALELAQENADRRRAEEEIESYRKRLESLINSSSDLIFLKDENFRYLVANQAHERLFNIKAEDIVGRTDFDFMPREIAERCRESDIEALERGFISQEECMDAKCFEVVKQRVVDAKGKVVGIAAVIRDISERKRAEEALRESKGKLSEQNLLLAEKNIALREVIGQVKAEKEKIEDRIRTNVSQLLFPLLARLKEKGSPLDTTYLELLEDNLRELTSSFGNKISARALGLTQREIEICDMIKSGLTSKEIADLLNIYHRTVENHRNSIRKKLGITKRRINLATYLNALGRTPVHPTT